jgi:hypothetical protein
MRLVKLATTNEELAKALARAGLGPRPPPRPRPAMLGQLEMKLGDTHAANASLAAVQWRVMERLPVALPHPGISDEAHTEYLAQVPPGERVVQLVPRHGQVALRIPGVKVLERHALPLDDIVEVYGDRATGTVVLVERKCMGDSCTAGTSSARASAVASTTSPESTSSSSIDASRSVREVVTLTARADRRYLRSTGRTACSSPSHRRSSR